MSIDFSPITQIANGLSNLALVSPNQTVGYQPTPTSGPPPPAFLFHIEGENTFDMDSDITDHFIEDNTAIQDQWALRPEKVVVQGFIAELNDSALGQQNILPIPAFLQPVVTKGLALISDFAPGLSVSAQDVYDTAFQGYQAAASVANSAVSAWNSLVNGSPTVQNKQQVAFQYFYGQLQARTLWKVQTPWAVFTDMAIQSLRAIQDDTTRVITNFVVTFKKIRVATVFQTVPPAVLVDRAFDQGSTALNNGTNTLTLGPTMTQQFAASFPGL